LAGRQLKKHREINYIIGRYYLFDIIMALGILAIVLLVARGWGQTQGLEGFGTDMRL
jgi:hypothetical protein